MRSIAPLATLAALLLAAAPAHADKALATKYGCLGCHGIDAKLVGPSYHEVAARYAGNTDAATLAERIRAGGSGHWGEMAMPPHPQVKPADAKKLAAWILDGAK